MTTIDKSFYTDNPDTPESILWAIAIGGVLYVDSFVGIPPTQIYWREGVAPHEKPFVAVMDKGANNPLSVMIECDTKSEAMQQCINWL